MRYFFQNLAGLSFFFALLPLASFASVLTSVNLPANTQVSWVGQQLNHNGLQIDALMFRSNLTAGAFVSHFRLLWADNVRPNSPAYVESSIGNWSVISTLLNHHSLVVQVSALNPAVTHGGALANISPDSRFKSSGFISVVDTGLLPTTQPVVRDVPLPRGSQTLSRTHSEDLISDASTLIVANNISVRQNMNHFERFMPTQGWRRSIRLNVDGVATLGFSKHQAYCEITITQGESGRSILMVARVNYD